MQTKKRIIVALKFLFDEDYVEKGHIYWGRYREDDQLMEGWWFEPPDDQHFFIGRDEFDVLDLICDLVEEERATTVVGVLGPSRRRWRL